MACCAFAGALLPSTFPVGVAIVALIVVYVLRRPLLLMLAVGLLCSSLAHRSWAGIHNVRDGVEQATGTVVTDPVRRGGGTSAVIRIDGKRVLASGWGAGGASLGRTEAGDLVEVEGTYRRYQGPDERKAALHVGTRLTIDSLTPAGPPGPLYWTANALRSRLSDGAASLSPQERALFTGLVYGDDRGQSALTEADFRLAGLTHLLAVSGQNVAYVLTLAGPMIRRSTLRGRWLATVSILVLFATVTRFEPSVLRATVMAGLAATGGLLGRDASGGRLLALAVTALLIVDPLLASTIAFRLSVAASAGIAWLRPVLVSRLRGPQWFTDTLSVTLAAQLAVAPLLVTEFGPVSLVSIPANVVAGPIAGLTMTWGMSAGLAAGFMPASWAALVHYVTAALLWILVSVARVAGLVPIAPVGLVWMSCAGLLSATRSLWKRSASGLLAAAVVGGALVLALLPTPVEGVHQVGPNSELWIQEGRSVLILQDANATTWLLDDIRARNVRNIDLVILSDDDAVQSQLQVLNKRVGVEAIRFIGDEGTQVHLGSLRLLVSASNGDISVTPSSG